MKDIDPWVEGEEEGRDGGPAGDEGEEGGPEYFGLGFRSVVSALSRGDFRLMFVWRSRAGV